MLTRCFYALALISFLGAQSAAERQVRILATASTQAAILPLEPYSISPSNRGWAKLASAIAAERNNAAEKNNAASTLLIDCGDTLQGSPLAFLHMAYIHSKERPDSPNPLIRIMNSLGYKAFVPSAHDFAFGLDYLKSAERQAQFPFIAANVTDASGNLLFKPFAKTAVDGVTVAILGLVAPSAPNILDVNVQTGLRVRDAVETAKEWIPKLRGAEKADLVIVVAHTSAEGPHVVPNEGNTAFLLAEQAPGIDAVIAAQGLQQMATWHKGVPIVQPSPLGQSIASITFRMQRQGSGWLAQPSSPVNIPLDPQSPQHPMVLQATEQARYDEDAYLNTPTAQLGVDLDGRWSTIEPTPLVQLLHDAQLRATGAQLSAAPSPGAHIYIPKGPTSVRQFFALAPHENSVARIRITGAQLRAYLEHAAKYFNYSYLPDLLNPTIPLADYDMVGGCSYSLDISRRPGKRVADLKFNGRPVTDGQEFTMAISTYRLAGGGGYMDAIGFKGQPEMISQKTLRYLLLEQAISRPAISISAPTVWRTVPFLDRERVLAVYK
jgi:2',3'-cyclic-nucleotide 2'-phosphodiesterase/3'-nucleotidase